MDPSNVELDNSFKNFKRYAGTACLDFDYYLQIVIASFNWRVHLGLSLVDPHFENDVGLHN